MRIFRAALSVGSNTLLSRITGFVRDIFIANLLGAGHLADIWVAAFRFPNLFRRIIAEGAFSAAFIPIYGRVLANKGQKQANLFTGNILSVMGAWVCLGIILLQILMPYLIYVFAPGFSEEFTLWAKDIGYAIINGAEIPSLPNMGHGDKISLAISITIICLPYAGFMFLAALMSAILNYHHSFYAPSFAPILLNITLITSLVISLFYGYDPLWILAYGVLVSGVLQIIWLYYALCKKGLHLKFGSIWAHQDFTDFKKLFWPGIISGGITQINLLIGSLIASFSAGAMATLYYADRIYQLPLGIIGVTLGVVLLPHLVKNIRDNQLEMAKDLMMQSTKMAAFLTLPAMVSLFVIPHNIVRLLFEYGAFTANDTIMVANSLRIYALGLPAFILIKIYSAGFYAAENTKKPMIFAGKSILVNIFLSIGLFPLIGFYGIIWGTITASWINVFYLYYGLKEYKLMYYPVNFIKAIVKIICISLLMGGGLHFYTRYFPYDTRLSDVYLIMAGMIFYFIFALVVAIFPQYGLKKLLFKK